MQQSRNTTSLHTAISRALHQLIPHQKRVHFSNTRSVRIFHSGEKPTLITYDSGADGHYLSKTDRISAGLPILRNSSKRLGVANGGSSQAKHVTQLPFQNISSNALQADSFDDFPTSLMSVGKISDTGTVSIFTSDGVTVHNEQDVLSHAKVNQSSLEYATSMADTVFHCTNTKANGSLEPKHFDKQTVSMIYPPPNRLSNGCMPFAGTPSNPLGSRQARLETLLAGLS